MSIRFLTVAERELRNASKPSEFLAAWLAHSDLLPEGSNRVFKHYYSNFGKLQSERVRWAYDQQLKQATTLVRSRPGLKLLEIGSGCGTESLWFATNGADVTSIDIKTDRLAVARARQKVLGDLTGRKLCCRFKEQNLLEMEEADRFDMIWIQQTFHHLEPRAECVLAISRLLRKGGSVVISEVNAWNPLIQLQLLRRRGFRTICYFEDQKGNQVPYGNERILTAARLRRWFRQGGLEDGDISYYRMLPSHRFFDKFAGFERMISGSPLIPLYTHYNFVATK